jgi:hypothetical protein
VWDQRRVAGGPPELERAVEAAEAKQAAAVVADFRERRAALG